jgi:hypothetical protein
MAIDRRALMVGSGASILAGALPTRADEPAPLYAAARRGTDGRYSAAIFSADGGDVRSVDLPGRGHDLTVCPVTRRCVGFARRPGNFAIAFSIDRAEATTTFTTPVDRHFYGHGIFSRDGRLLYATENDFEAARGMIGVYDAMAGFKRIGEFPSYGVGPHDLTLLRQQNVLVIANGGLREHPDIGRGRRILNPNAIETSLAYVDPRNGDLLERHILGKPGALSLRHIVVGRDDTIVIGAQLPGPSQLEATLVYRHRRQQPLTSVSLPGEVVSWLSGYVSSVAVDRSGDVAGITSSRGNLVMMIEVATGRVLRTVTCADISGVSPTAADSAFLVTSGKGEVVTVTMASGPGRSVVAPWEWDNHAVMIA